MTELTQNFLKYLRYEKGFSNHTIKSYKEDLENFFEFLKNEKIEDIKSLNYSVLTGYITFLGKKGFKASTIERKIASLKTFFKYLVKKKFISKNPAELISSPKKQKRLPSVLEVGEIFDLINIIPEDSPFSVRNKAMIMLLYASGLRVSELTGLNLGDLDLKNGLVRILGKGKKYRIVPVGNKTKAILYKYFLYRREFQPRGEALFVTKSGKRIQDRMVRYIINVYINELAIQKKVSPHTLRHTFATHLLDNGANIRVIQEMLGHSSLSTTQIYTHLSIEKLKKAYQEFHPHA
jgi:integrase/recombinase XerC